MMVKMENEVAQIQGQMSSSSVLLERMKAFRTFSAWTESQNAELTHRERAAMKAARKGLAAHGTLDLENERMEEWVISVMKTSADVVLEMLAVLVDVRTPSFRRALGNVLLTLSRSPFGIVFGPEFGRLLSWYSLQVIPTFEDAVPDLDEDDALDPADLVIRHLEIQVLPRNSRSLRAGGRMARPTEEAERSHGSGRSDHGLGGGLPASFPTAPHADHFGSRLKVPLEWRESERHVVQLMVCLDIKVELGQNDLDEQLFECTLHSNRCWAPSAGPVGLRRLRFYGNVACWWHLKRSQLKLSCLLDEPPAVWWDTVGTLEAWGRRCPSHVEERAGVDIFERAVRHHLTYPKCVTLDLTEASLHESLATFVADIWRWVPAPSPDPWHSQCPPTPFTTTAHSSDQRTSACLAVASHALLFASGETRLCNDVRHRLLLRAGAWRRVRHHNVHRMNTPSIARALTRTLRTAGRGHTAKQRADTRQTDRQRA